MPIVSITAWATQRDISSSPSSRASADSVTNASSSAGAPESSTVTAPLSSGAAVSSLAAAGVAAPAAVDEVSPSSSSPHAASARTASGRARKPAVTRRRGPVSRASPRASEPGGTAGVMWTGLPRLAAAETGDRSPPGPRRPNVVVMQGLMQDVPLTVIQLFERAEQVFAHKGVDDGDAGRPPATDLRGLGASGPVGSAACSTPSTSRPTAGWGRSPGTRRGTSSCTSPRPCTGRVLHTLNIRLFPEQLTYIVNHADDEVIFVDRSLLALLGPLLPTFERLRHLVVMDDWVPRRRRRRPDLGGREPLDYEALLADSAAIEFHVDDEHRAASMCYTSGTTGNPERRRVQPPLDVPAHHVDDDGRHAGRPRVGSHPAGRADVPRERVGPRPLRGGLRRRPRHARPRPLRSGDRRPHRRGAGDRRRRRADDLDAGAAEPRGPRHVDFGRSRAAGRRCPRRCPSPIASSSDCRSCRRGG